MIGSKIKITSSGYDPSANDPTLGEHAIKPVIVDDPGGNPAVEEGAADNAVAVIKYKNHRGEVSLRGIIPREFYHGSTTYYPTPCYLLRAWDVDKNAERTFAMRNVLQWLDSGSEPPVNRA